MNQKRQIILNIQVPDEVQAVLLDELIWEFHRGNVKLKSTSRGSDGIVSIGYEKIVVPKTTVADKQSK